MNVILLVAAIVISLVIFGWLLKVVRVTIRTAITVAIVVLILQLVFGIGPGQVWQQVSQIPQAIWYFITGNR
jgi:type IV secretory pathway TrbL component